MEKQSETNPQEEIRRSIKSLLQNYGLDAVVDGLVLAAAESNTNALDLVTAMLSGKDPSLRGEDRLMEPKEKLEKCMKALEHHFWSDYLLKKSADKTLDISDT